MRLLLFGESHCGWKNEYTASLSFIRVGQSIACLLDFSVLRPGCPSQSRSPSISSSLEIPYLELHVLPERMFPCLLPQVPAWEVSVHSGSMVLFGRLCWNPPSLGLGSVVLAVSRTCANLHAVHEQLFKAQTCLNSP